MYIEFWPKKKNSQPKNQLWVYHLVGGFNPSEKYSLNWIISRGIGVKIPKIFELPPPSHAIIALESSNCWETTRSIPCGMRSPHLLHLVTSSRRETVAVVDELVGDWTPKDLGPQFSRVKNLRKKYEKYHVSWKTVSQGCFFVWGIKMKVSIYSVFERKMPTPWDSKLRDRLIELKKNSTVILWMEEIWLTSWGW